MRAFIHSIHSQVPATIAEIGPRPERILSLDSHLDVSLGRDPGVYPEVLRTIVERTSVHSEFSRILTGGEGDGRRRGAREPPAVTVAIPELMLASHASDIELGLPPSLRAADASESVASVREFLRSSMGIDVFPSPPRALAGLKPWTEARGSWLLDIDVDYMCEMQDECFTQIKGAGPGVLQTAANVLEFVRATRPENITVSEAMTSAIRDPTSNFSGFLDALKGLGYSLEERGPFESDAEVLRRIDDCRAFYLKVSRPLMKRNMGSMMKGDYSTFEKEERSAARDFFKSRGYH